MLSWVATTMSTHVLNGDREQSEVAFQGMVHFDLDFFTTAVAGPEVCDYDHGGRWVIVR